jgi:hypothetical protein
VSVRRYLPGTASPGTVVPFSCPSLWFTSVQDLVVEVGVHLHISVLDHKDTDFAWLDISMVVRSTYAVLPTVRILRKSIRDYQTTRAAADDHIIV